MKELMWLAITVVVAVIGGTVFQKIKFPAGPLVGAIIVVGLLNIFTGKMFMPSEVKILTKTVAGCFIGLSVTRDSVKALIKLVKPAVVLIVCVNLFCVAMGLVLYFTTGFDLVTAMFSVAPGGVMDMSLLTIDMGGDSAVVALLQVIRILTVYCVSLPLVKLIGNLSNKRKAKAGVEIVAAEKAAEETPKKKMTKEEQKKGIVYASCVAAAAGITGHIIGELIDFSSAIMVFTMIVCAAVNIKTEKLYMPKKVRRFTQMLSGALIGLNMTYDSMINLKNALVPAICVVIGFAVINILLALLLHKVGKLDIVTAMMSSSPGGATEFALMAPDFGADAATVAVLQVSRLSLNIVIFPILVKVLIGIL